MAKSGRILIADDETIFSNATADLLRQEGYECDVAPDAHTAAALLTRTPYDLLIADIKMPGNDGLEFIRDLPRVTQGIPVILVTGYPSLRTAIQSIQLPVVAYLTKPVEFDELKTQVRNCIQGYQAYQTIRNTRQRLETSCNNLTDLEKLLKDAPKINDKPATSINNFFDLSLINIIGALSDLRHLTANLGISKNNVEVCHLMNCPKLERYKAALVDTIDVLEHTQNAFKSKELGELRKKLETLIHEGSTA